jgi:hypothetical protein
MASIKLTNTMRKDIALNAVRGLYVKPLLEIHKEVERQVDEIVKKHYSKFDWENVESYRDFINWHDSIEFNELPEKWHIQYDTFRVIILNVPQNNYFKLSFKYPSREQYTGYISKVYKKSVENILRPYMTLYFAAKEFYEELEQVLLGFTTIKQLEEGLPELKKYLPEINNGSTFTLVPIEKINRIKAIFNRNSEEE